jgi:hypothetical protein
MIRRTRALFLAAVSTLAVGVMAAPAAQASLLSVLPGSCGSQVESQPFSPWWDFNSYTLVPGGDFEHGSSGWLLFGGAAITAGNESFHVGGLGDSHSLALPAGSSATSPSSCTSIYHPTVRFFVRNTGSANSRLVVQALYPGLLGGVQTSTLGQISGSSSWAPSPAMSLLVNNLLSTVSLDETTIAFRFIPADSTGAWSIDDVYLDPYFRG